MSITIAVSNEIASHLDNLSFGEAGDINEKLRNLIVSEYQRRLARYRLTDRQMTQKYQMSYETFDQQQMTRQHGYTWAVETDVMAWETAIDGIRPIEQQLPN
ncbi:MAG: hypothetical protein ACREOO_25185 [bacterium]